MGLRQIKKDRTRAHIIANAVALFSERGFERVPVREIAARAEISEASFFNYFATKDAVLGEWAHAAVASALAEGARESISLRRAAREAARLLIRAVERDGELMTMAWSRARLQPPPHAFRVARQVLVEAIRAAQRREELRRDVSAEELARLLHQAAAVALASSLCEPGDARSPLSGLQRALDLVLDGARRRNERVRAAARLTRAP